MDTRVRRPARPASKPAVKPDRKQAILLAAEKLFAQRGYHAVSIRQIASSHPGESTTMGATLVSPPPPQTMAKIREQVDTRGDARSTPRNGPAPSRGGDAPRTQRIELQPTQFDPPHPARARSRGLWIGGGALALLGLGIGAWAVFGGAGQPAGGAGPRRGSAQEDPPERDQD
ncbi:MAG: helix-turn-helix domain-containing protein, partial [Giesbergeria sp.]